MKKLMSIAVTMATLSFGSSAFASNLGTKAMAEQTWWMNIAGHFSVEDNRYYESFSLPTTSHDACSNAIVEYAKNNYVYSVSCSLKPLPDAANIRGSQRFRR